MDVQRKWLRILKTLSSFLLSLFLLIFLSFFLMILAPGDPSCFGADPDLLLNWWYGDNVWMQTRCPWKESAEWQKLHGLMDEALAAEGDEQQKKWNECFDIIADNAVLYPVVHVKTVSASWDDPSTAPNGEALDGFKGIGTTSMSFRGVATVKA